MAILAPALCGNVGGRPLDGMVALVSGGGRGVGRLLGARLAGAGAAVGLIARSADELAAAAGEINRAGGTAAAAVADVADHRAAAAAVSELRHNLGTADILINNAGISGPVGPLWQAQTAEWWRAIEVNLGGAFILSQLALEHMIPAGKGRIINVTSYAGVYRWPLLSAYAASKAALVEADRDPGRRDTPARRVGVQRPPRPAAHRPRRGGAEDQRRPGGRQRAVSSAGSATSSPPGAAPTPGRRPA